MVFENEITIIMSANSKNEAFARITVAAFVSQLDPNVGDITDIKTAVSEAVTNSIIHGYDNKIDRGSVSLSCAYKEDMIYIEISDEGKGIENIEQARTPLYTTKPEQERSGMGFTVMETFMDEVTVFSEAGSGTTVKMNKKLTR